MGNCMGRQNNAVEVVAPQASAGELDEPAAASRRDGKLRSDEAALAVDDGVSLPGAVDAGSPPELLAIAGAAQIAASVAPPLAPVAPAGSSTAAATADRGALTAIDGMPEPPSRPATAEAEAGGSGETSGEHGSTMAEEDAAITIQRWWCGNRDQSLTSLCLAFQSVGLTAAWAKSVAFDELALCLQREDLLQVISMLLRRLTDGQAHVRRRRGLGDDSDDDPEADCGDEDDEDDEADELMDKLGDAHGGFMTEPSRVLLSAYVVCTHPEVVFAESNLRSGTRQEQNLRAAANMFVSALEMLCQSVAEGAEEEEEEEAAAAAGARAGVDDDGGHIRRQSRREEVAVLVERFQTVWSEYQRRFTSWKQSSTAFLTDELVAAYLELEAAKLAADGTEAGLVTSIGALPAVLDGTEDHLLDDHGHHRGDLDDDDTDDDGGAGTDDDRHSGDGTDGCLDEIEARQNTIRQAIARNGTGAELKLQQALDQYSSTQQAANAQLAHEIILNPDLQLLPARDPDMLRVRGIATRAFWTSVRDEVRAAAEGDSSGGAEAAAAAHGGYGGYGYGYGDEHDDHDGSAHMGGGGGGAARFGRVLSLLTEVREGLIGLTTNAQFTEDVCEALDIDFLQQQMEHGSLNNEDVLKLLRFVVEKIIELDAPAYEDDSRAWLSGLVESLADPHTPSDFAQFVVEIFAWLFAKLEQIRVGVANFHLRSLSAVLRSHGVEYEQAAFAQQLNRGDQTMQLTLAWLRETIDGEALDVTKLNNGDIKEVASAPKLGVVRLCLKSTALVYDECPEVLRMDLMRLLTFQNQAQRLAVVGATIVVLQQVLAQHGLADLTSVDDADETGGSGSLSDTLYVSLQRPEIRLPALIDHVVKVADTHVRHMRLLRRARGEPEQENQARAFNKDQVCTVHSTHHLRRTFPQYFLMIAGTLGSGSNSAVWCRALLCVGMSALSLSLCVCVCVCSCVVCWR
jgi:hypothetical protein